MNLESLLIDLNQRNIKITVLGNDLDIEADKGAITPELKKKIKVYKKDIIRVLKNIEEDRLIVKLVDRGELLPLSFGQQRLWFVNQLEGGKGSQYNISWGLRLMGVISIAALEAAINALICRHESFRTTFHTVDEQAIQVVEDISAVTIPITHIVEADVSHCLADNANHVFDLREGPLLKVELLCLSPKEHVLLLNMHHIIFDAWSRGIFHRELSLLYKAYCQDETCSLPLLPIQYADFAHWQRQWLQGDVLKQQIDYWKCQLSDAPTLLALPTDRPRPTTQSYRGKGYSFTLPAALTRGLHQLSRQQGATLFMTLLAGFNLLLARYSGQDDICVGTPIANRQRPELENLIGFFINTLILRTRINQEITTKELLQQVKETALAGYAHQDIPFEHLVEVLKPARSLSYSPLFQVMFVLQNATDNAFTLSNLDASPIESEWFTAKFDLTFFVEETDDFIRGAVEYNIDLFDPLTITKMIDHYQVLLENMAASPDQRIASLGLLRESERRHILFDWNDTKKVYPSHKGIHQLFEQQVERTPNIIAAVCEDQKITYKELNKKSNQLAYCLIEHGVAPDTRIGLCAERSLEMTIGLLGILKAGGACVPLDPNYPKSRLAYMLEEADISILLTQKVLCQRLPVQENVITLDGRMMWLSKPKATQKNPRVAIEAEHLAYVIFTSGSTGRPKAVAMPHFALSNLVQWQLEHSDCAIGDKTLQFSSLSFDVSFQELFSTWCSGGTLVLVAEEKRKDPFTLWGVIREHQINRLYMPFIALQQLAEVYHEEIQRLTESQSVGRSTGLCSLKEIVTAGEQLQITPAIRRLFQQLKRCRLYNHYGPSETHVCTALALEGEPDTWEPLPSIGKPIANEKVYILDKLLQPVPVGVYGELYAGGIGLARGYLNREDLTTERFIQNPFNGDVDNQSTGDRLYKTGDLARFRADGTIEYKGRVDSQVKIRGYRIEPGEIENILSEQLGIGEVVVGVHNRGQQAHDRYLVAYMVAEERTSATQAQTREHLRKTLQDVLPEYMVPSLFIFLDALPLTASGKVDRKALPAPDDDALATQKYLTPRTETERALVTIWADILKLSVDKVGIQDNFFDLGGHSLLATRVVSQIRKTFNIDIQIRDLFTANTIQNLSSLVEDALVNSPLLDKDAYPLERMECRDAPALSFAQQRLWFINQFEGGRGVQYNLPWALRLQGGLNITALEQAFSTLVQRHGSLRTTFHTVNDRAIQVIADTLRLTIPVTEVAEIDIPAHLTANANHLFDLSQGPLLKVELLSLSPEEHILLLNMHHIISDGWSMGVFNHELAILYAAYCRDKASPLAPLSIQYSDFAQWQRQWLQGKVLERQLDYWKTQLRGVPAVLELPTDRPRPATQRYRGRGYSFTLPEELTQRLHQLSRQEGTTLFMTLLAGFNLLLARYSGQKDLCVGTPIANRQRPELEKLIGFFVNTLVLRTQIKDNMTVKALLQQVKETALSAYAHQDIPFEYLIEALKPKRSLSYSPLFQVMFVLQNHEEDILELSGLDTSFINRDIDTAKFDLSLYLGDTSGGLEGVLEYNTDLLNKRTVEQLVSHYKVLLEGMVNFPDKPIAELPLLSASERQKILFDWNKTEATYPEGKCIHQLFEEQVEKTPDAVAIIFEDQLLSYEALNRKSNQLAHYLIAQDVRQEVKVGLCVERSLEMVIGLLGILKSGGAYVPIDPGYPQQRIDYIEEDSGIEILLTKLALSTPLAKKEKQKTTIYLDIDWDVISKFSDVSANANVKENNLAYLIYTSGSTGKPKGVMINHENIVNTLYFLESTYPVTENDVYLLKTNYVFDVSISELFGWFFGCGHLVILPPQLEKCPGALITCITENQITHVNFVPSMLSVFLEEISCNSKLLKNCPIKYLMVAGEAFSKSSVTESIDVFEKARIENIYGPTESSIYSAWFSCSIDKIHSASTPIGKPLANTQLYIVDDQLNPVPIGVAGELCISGKGLARGYLNRPELTAEKFINSPFNSGSRLYRTGDLARWLGDGNIEYLGRRDDQIKIRGFRIELGEIETVLTQQPSVREAVVLVKTRGQGTDGQYMIAYVVGVESTGIDQSSLRAVLEIQLPDYMIPGLFVFLDELPLTPNGKLDRKALLALDEQALMSTAHTAPRSAVEEMLVTIWADLLHLPADKVSIRDNFFELGGDSIISIQVASRAYKQGIVINTRHLFEYQTIEELAQYTQENVCDIAQTPSKGEFSLLPIQHWFFMGDAVDRHHFHQSFLLHVPPGFDFDFLCRFITILYHRHDALRLRFFHHASTKQWRASFVPFAPVMTEQAVEEVPLVKQTAARRKAVLAESGEAIKGRLDVTNGPLIKAVYFKADKSQDSRLLLVIHHLVIDGVSWRILLEDLSLAFDQWQAGTLLTLPPKTSAYQQWGAKLTTYSGTDVISAEKDYWISMLSSTPPIPVDKVGGPANLYGETAYIDVKLNVDETQALLNRCHRPYHTQINDLLLSALLLAFFRWRGLTALSLTLEGHGREDLFGDIDLTSTLGWFTSMYPLRLSLPRDTESNGLICELIKTVKEQCRAVPNKGIGYGLLRHLAEDNDLILAERDQAQKIVFNYLGQFDQQLGRHHTFSEAEEATGNDISPSRQRMELLGCNGLIVNGSLHFSLDYSRRQYYPETMEELGLAYEIALREVIEHCQRPEVGSYTPSDFPLAMLSQVEVDRWQTIYPNLADIYPATGMQAGLLFHNLLDGDTAYVVQIEWRMLGNIDVKVLQQAWQSIVARHAVFRTAFVDRESGQLLQITVDQVDLPWFQVDWRYMSKQQKNAKFRDYCYSDKAKGFIANQPPLMRCALFRETDTCYRFLWTYHHSLLDGWSLPIVLDELVNGYLRYSLRDHCVFPAAPPYRNYIRWLEQQDHKAAMAFWQEQLQEVVAPTALAIDQLPVDEQFTGPQIYRYSLTNELTQQLEELARRYRVTLNTIVQGAWTYLLHRYSGDFKVVFGETVSGRPADLLHAERMVGLFISTQPVCNTVDGNLKIKTWLQRLHRAQAQRLSYSYLPLVEIRRSSKIPQSCKLFNTLLVFENYPIGDVLAENLEEEQEIKGKSKKLEITDLCGHEGTTYDLTLSVQPGDCLSFDMQYDAGKYSQATIKRTMLHIDTVLKGLTSKTVSIVADLPILTAREKQKVLYNWNKTEVDYLKDKCVYQLFEEQVEKTPDTVAVIFEDQQLTYEELNQRSNQLAHYLIERGVKPEVKVGLCVGRSLGMMIALLGIQKAGGVYVPIDPGYPQQRIDYLVKDSGIALILTQTQLSTKVFSKQGVVSISLDRDWAVVDTYSRKRARVSIKPESLIYVIYTSGSTGKPKGVQLSHGAYTNHMQWIKKAFDFSDHDKILHKTPLIFDAAGWEWSLPLMLGAQLILAKPEGHRDPEYLLDLMDQYQITVFQAVPSLLNLLLDDDRREKMNSLRFLFCGGEPLPVSTCVRFKESKLTGLLCNLYGPTEAAIDSTYWVFNKDKPPTTIPIGRPIDNVQIYLLDEELNPAPIGVLGEIYIGGDGLSRGYLNREDLTAEKFVSNPFDKRSGLRLYRSGDLGRYLPDGNIEYVGRIDTQVKVRGFRIELGEVENTLIEQENIREAVVLTHSREEDAANHYLVAYIVCEKSAGVDQTVLRTTLRKQLPDHMIPNFFILMEELPLTFSGKVDRKALPEPDEGRLITQEYIEPCTETEQVLVTIWGDVLNLPTDKISIRDSFFELGGHSLLATRLLTRIQRKLLIDLPMKILFENTTVEDLARKIDEKETTISNLLNVDIENLTDEQAENILKTLA